MQIDYEDFTADTATSIRLACDLAENARLAEDYRKFEIHLKGAVAFYELWTTAVSKLPVAGTKHDAAMLWAIIGTLEPQDATRMS